MERHWAHLSLPFVLVEDIPLCLWSSRWKHTPESVHQQTQPLASFCEHRSYCLPPSSSCRYHSYCLFIFLLNYKALSRNIVHVLLLVALAFFSEMSEVFSKLSFSKNTVSSLLCILNPSGSGMGIQVDYQMPVAYWIYLTLLKRNGLLSPSPNKHTRPW